MKPYPLSKEQARALVDAVGEGHDPLRNRAHVVMLYRAGLRVLESCQQEFVDWMPRKNGTSVIRVSHPKGEATWGWHRNVGLDQQATAIIGQWIAERGTEAGPMFLTSAGRRIHPTHIRRLLRRVAAGIGIRRRVHPHCLRHTFARELYDEGKGIREIQLALGHSSLATTEKYLLSIGASEAVAATIERADW